MAATRGRPRKLASNPVIAASTDPVEPPTSSPVLRAARRHSRMASRSGTCTISSASSGWHSSGRRLVPRPGMRRGPGSPPNVTEPSVSTAMMRVSGECCRRYRAQPTNVPVEPAPTNR
jgi:hypothetical protein